MWQKLKMLLASKWQKPWWLWSTRSFPVFQVEWQSWVHCMFRTPHLTVELQFQRWFAKTYRRSSSLELFFSHVPHFYSLQTKYSGSSWDGRGNSINKLLPSVYQGVWGDWGEASLLGKVQRSCSVQLDWRMLRKLLENWLSRPFQTYVLLLCKS